MHALVRTSARPLPALDRMPGPRARRACWWWAGGLAGGALALLVLVEAGWGPLLAADRVVAARLHRVAVAEPGWTHANRLLTDWVWDPITMRLLSAAVAAVLALRGALRLAVWVAVTGLVSLVVQTAFKAGTERGRPRFPDPVDSSPTWAFPSGHAMTATVVCGLLLALLLLLGPRTAAVRAVGWAVAVVSVAGVGFTRVYLGVHWWTDVVAGWLLGGAVLAVCSAWLVPWRGTPRVRAGDS